MAKEPEAQSKLHVEAELGRDMAQLTKLDLHTGAASELVAMGALKHFAKPEWQASIKGSLELKQISVLSGVDGLKAGSLDLDVKGHSCYTAPAEAQKQPRFWQRHHPKDAAQAEHEGAAARSGLRGGISRGRRCKAAQRRVSR